ncbi:MAG: AAA family ATPase [Spirulina sp. SIO3F2]|nr:AAA family ATPase [Spirulina sp. SIO3F2]
MEEIFVTKIDIHQARNVKDLIIELSETERRHLIITGKNGSGKTSLLLELNKYLSQVIDGRLEERYRVLPQLDALKKESISNREGGIANLELEQSIESLSTLLGEFGETEITFFNENHLNHRIINRDFLVIYFRDKRESKPIVPSGIKKIEFKDRYFSESSLGSQFIQYLVNLKADRSFARDDGDNKEVERLDQWFDDFEKKLRDIFDAPSLRLKFDRKGRGYDFKIIEDGKEPYGFHQLPAGYSAIISILSELILRIEAYGIKGYDVQGIFLIDEIETHLHVNLQKKILPLLTSFFPKIQFIVTTHSPFVISSIPNAVVCDLEKRLVINDTDLSGYSYDTLIESYFGADKYSDIVKHNLNEYEELVRAKDNLSPEQELRLVDLQEYFDSLPGYLVELNSELSTRLTQIKLGIS